MSDSVEKIRNKFNYYRTIRKSGEMELEELKEKRSNAYTVNSRIRDIADQGSFQEFSYDFPDINPLGFDGYVEKKNALREKTGYEEAVISGTALIGGYPAVLAVMNKHFFMGSMGIELGERISRAVEVAQEKKIPLVIFTASGGARMQEGMLSLLQMAKTAAVIERFKNAGGLYIAVLTNPTTGGVSASFATLGDITLAEPGALIGFAGPRVIEQTIGTKLPEGFQRAEFLEEHGFVDQVVPREKMKETLIQLLKLHGGVYEGN